ncbi:MAG: 2-amino-4-hydroxy-6-hydroxymethyldihydropteridine diphosphokinase [Mycobacteriales bacterium]
MSRAVLSVGSNLGDRLAYLQSAVDALRPYLVSVSAVYETAAFGTEPQAPYLNAVLLVQAEVDDFFWLERAREIEAGAGRRRERRWAPRTLDVDVITVDAQVSADPELTLPHPRAHERAFVLVPWLDVEPKAVLAEIAVADLVSGLDVSGVRRRDDLVLR